MGICDDGTSWTADGTVTTMAFADLGTIEKKTGREVWLQLTGNQLVILTETDADRPNGIWFAPLSIVREKILTAVTEERATMALGAARAMRFVSITTSPAGRKLARRGWRWASRDGRGETIEWLDAAPTDWETYCQHVWPRTPAPQLADHAEAA